MFIALASKTSFHIEIGVISSKLDSVVDYLVIGIYVQQIKTLRINNWHITGYDFLFILYTELPPKIIVTQIDKYCCVKDLYSKGFSLENSLKLCVAFIAQYE